MKHDVITCDGCQGGFTYGYVVSAGIVLPRPLYFCTLGCMSRNRDRVAESREPKDES